MEAYGSIQGELNLIRMISISYYSHIKGLNEAVINRAVLIIMFRLNRLKKNFWIPAFTGMTEDRGNVPNVWATRRNDVTPSDL